MWSLCLSPARRADTPSSRATTQGKSAPQASSGTDPHAAQRVDTFLVLCKLLQVLSHREGHVVLLDRVALDAAGLHVQSQGKGTRGRALVLQAVVRAQVSERGPDAFQDLHKTCSGGDSAGGGRGCTRGPSTNIKPKGLHIGPGAPCACFDTVVHGGVASFGL